MRLTDKELVSQLLAIGVPYQAARNAIGLIVEERESSYQEGYRKGFNDGAEFQKNRKENNNATA